MATEDVLIQEEPERPLKTGVCLRITPGAPGFEIQLERATSAAGPWTILGYLKNVPLAGGPYVDPLPASKAGTTYYYRWCHTRRGWTDGSYSPIVAARAGYVAETLYGQSARLELDAIEDGATYQRTTADEKTGAGRAFDAIGENLEILTSPGFDAAWLEDFDTDTRGRFTATGCTLDEPAASYTTLTSTTVDPQLYIDQATGRLEAFHGGTYQYVALRYRYAGPPDTLQVFYQRAGVHDESDSYVKNHALYNDGLWHTVLLDMHALDAGGTDWADGAISRVRLDPLTAAGRTLDLDFVTICTKRIGASRLLSALYEDGSLVENVQQTEAGQKRPLVKGRQSFDGVRSEDVIEFNPVFQAIPAGRIDASGAITYQPDSAQWSTPGAFSAAKAQIPQMRLLDKTVSSARVWCYLFQRGIVTPQAAQFTGATLDATGETDVATVASATITPTRYTIRARVTLGATPKTNQAVTVTLVYAIDSIIDGLEEERDTVTRSFTTAAAAGVADDFSYDVATTVDVSGMDSDDQFRLRIVSITVSGAYTALVAQVVGNTGANNNGEAGVSYATSTDIWSNMTPTTDETVDVVVEGYQ